MKFLKSFVVATCLLFGFSFFSGDIQVHADMTPQWIQKKIDDYHKSDNKIAGMLGLIYSLGGIVVFFAYFPQFLAQIRKNKQISSLTFTLFGAVNTVGLAYAITSGTTPLMVTMFPATFWCWLMVSTNEIKRRRGDFDMTLDGLLKDLKKVLDPENDDHIEVFNNFFRGLGITNREQIGYLVNKLEEHSKRIDEFIQLYNYLLHDCQRNKSIQEKMWHYLDTLTFPAGEYDLLGKPIFLNQAFIQATEYSKEELFATKNITQLLYKGKDYQEVDEALENLKKQGEGYVRRMFTLTTKNGKHRTIHWTTQPTRDEEGKVIGTVRFGIDTEVALDAKMDAVVSI